MCGDVFEETHGLIRGGHIVVAVLENLPNRERHVDLSGSAYVNHVTVSYRRHETNLVVFEDAL
jgi:hypothetical protein